MPFFPTITPGPTARLLTDSFLGYDRRARVPDGAWQHMENLSSRQSPLMSVRERRGTVTTLTQPMGLAAKDAAARPDGKLPLHRPPRRHRA